MKKHYPVLRSVVWGMCAYHLFLGCTLNGPGNWISTVLTHLLGATRIPDASALFAGRMLGVYLIVFGLGLGLAAWNPIKNRALLSLGAILVVIRGIQRLVQFQDLETALGIPASTNWTAVAILWAFGVTLVFFRYRVFKEMRQSGLAAE